MPTQVNESFVNNQNFLLVFNMSEWASLYDLTKARFRMQIRGQPLGPIIYAFDTTPSGSVRGQISYLAPAQLLIASASYDDVRVYMPSGLYEQDITMEIDDPASGALLINRVVASGTIVISDGITLR